MEGNIFIFLVSVVAGIISNYICTLCKGLRERMKKKVTGKHFIIIVDIVAIIAISIIVYFILGFVK